MKDPAKNIGNEFQNVTLVTFIEKGISRPRVKPIDTFPSNIRVEFPTKLREEFPIGTKFKASVKVCQKQSKVTCKNIGDPYLRATDIGVIVSSINDKGLRAKIQPGSYSGRSYYYIWK